MPLGFDHFWEKGEKMRRHESQLSRKSLKIMDKIQTERDTLMVQLKTVNLLFSLLLYLFLAFLAAMNSV